MQQDGIDTPLLNDGELWYHSISFNIGPFRSIQTPITVSFDSGCATLRHHSTPDPNADQIFGVSVTSLSQGHFLRMLFTSISRRKSQLATQEM